MGLIIAERSPTWRRDLSAYLTGCTAKTWGTNPCCTFMAGAVRAMTGKTPVPGLRRSISDNKMAALLAEYGVTDWPDALADREIEPANILIGDLAAVDNNGRFGGAVCVGAQLAAIDARGKLGYVSRSATVRGFRV